MSELVIQPGNVPHDLVMPPTPQGMVNLMAATLKISGLETLSGVIISASEPKAADRDKLWAKKDPSNDRVLGLYVYRGGWIQIPVAVASGERPPAGPQVGELFFNTKAGALEIWTGTAWTSNAYPSGTTEERPASAPLNYLYFDTTIQRLLRKVSQGWTTFDGFVGEIRIADPDVSEDAILERNPGWSVYEKLAGRAPFGREDADSEYFTPGKSGGRKSFLWSARGGESDGGGESGTLAGVTIDGKSANSAPNSGAVKEVGSGEVEILPPYYTVVFIRKNY